MILARPRRPAGRIASLGAGPGVRGGLAAAVACLLALALALAPATAEARRIVVVGLAATGSVSSADAERLGNAIAAATRERGHEVLAPAEAAAAIDGRIPGCSASRRPSCWATAARALGHEIVISGRIARDAATAELSISIEAIDTESVRAVAEASHHAAAQAPEELDALARAVAGTLLDALPAPRRRARLSVTSQPSGAAVTVNSRLMGETPWAGEVTEGPTTLLVELEGHAPQSRSFSLQADEVQEVHVELAERGGGGGGGRGRRRGPHAFDLVDSVLLGVAGVGVLGGTSVLVASALPGEECVGEPDAAGECPRTRRAANVWPLAGAIALGVAAGAAVLVRLVLGDPLPVAPTADAEAGTVGVVGHF